MRCPGVSQRMDRGLLCDSAFFQCSAESILQVTNWNRPVAGRAADSASSACRKNPDWVAMCPPELPQVLQSCFGKWHQPLLVPLGLTHVYIHPSAIDILHRQVCSLLQSKSAGVDRLQAYTVNWK